MIKKILILLLSVNLYALDNDESNNMLPTTQTIIYGVGGTVLIVGGVIAAPLILPAGTIIVIQTAVATAATQIVTAGTYVISNLTASSWISLGLTGARVVRPCIIQTLDEELAQLIKDDVTELFEERNKLSKCLLKNKTNSQIDKLGCPLICQDRAYSFALIAGKNELDRMLSSIK